MLRVRCFASMHQTKQVSDISLRSREIEELARSAGFAADRPDGLGAHGKSYCSFPANQHASRSGKCDEKAHLRAVDFGKACRASALLRVRFVGNLRERSADQSRGGKTGAGRA